MKATDFLRESLETLEEKAKLRDQPNGERNMKKTVDAYNILTGSNMSEKDGWLFMLILKITRMQTGKYNPDDYIDTNCYSSLLGECAENVERERRKSDHRDLHETEQSHQELGRDSETEFPNYVGSTVSIRTDNSN